MRLEIPILFVVAFSLAFSFQYAAAAPEVGVCQSVISGSWTDPDVWNCELTGPGNGPPPVGGEGFVNDGHTVTVTVDVNMDPGTGNGGVKINPGGTIIVNKDVTLQTGFFRNFSGIFENFGVLIVTNTFQNSKVFNNNCGGTVVIGNGVVSISSAENTLLGIFNNHGTFELKTPQNSAFENLGAFNSGGTLINVNQGDNFVGNTISPIPSICIVGGESLPIDSTALILAGAQMNAIWILPLIVAAAGIGIVVSRKFWKFLIPSMR